MYRVKTTLHHCSLKINNFIMKKSFKNILLFSLVSVIYQGFTAIGYGQPLVSVAFEPTTPLAVGERINVNIQITKGQDVTGYELIVNFDPTALRYIEGANANYLPSGTFALSPIVSDKTVYMAATSILGAASANEGTLARLKFEVVKARDSTIKLMDVILSNSIGLPLAVATRNGHIMAIQLPSIGDIDGNGKVNILDLTLVASNFNVVTNVVTPANPNVDVNEDGVVNILDLVLVSQHLDAIGGNKVKPEVGIIPVNPEETAVTLTGAPIDFASEKAAIQKVYSAFYKAFNDEDLKAIGETFQTSDGKVAFGTIFAGNEPVPIAFGWTNVKVSIEGLWIGIGTKGAKWGQNDKLADFWIRYNGSKWEAAAIGYNCYKGAFPGETHLYLMKDGKGMWKIHELDSSTENNLGIFGFHKGNPRLKKFITLTKEEYRVP